MTSGEGTPVSSVALPPARDRVTLITAGALLALSAAAWVRVVLEALRGDDMMMTMPMPLATGDAVAFVVSWAVMMTAMMLPSALPMITLYGAVQRRADGAAPAGAPVAAFTLVYLAVWAASGAPVYLAHTGLMTLRGRSFALAVAAILVVAGLFQFSALKRACLSACRSPLGFLLGHWRAGVAGSLALGWRHAIYCLGCCWALMLVLVAAGAMGLQWVLLITGVVAAEKLLPGGDRVARIGGAVLVLLGAAAALSPDLVTALRGHPM